MTEYPYCDYSEFYLQTRGNITPIVVVTHQLNTLSCILFEREIFNELLETGILTETDDREVVYEDNMYTMDHWILRRVIADLYTKKYGVVTLNNPYIERISNDTGKHYKAQYFKYYRSCVYNGCFFQEDFKENEIYLHDKTYCYSDAEKDNFRDHIKCLCICETVDEVLDSIHISLLSPSKYKDSEIIKKRITFISSLYKHIKTELSSVIFKYDLKYKKLKDYYLFLHNGCGLHTDEPYTSTMINYERFSKIINIADDLNFPYDADELKLFKMTEVNG